MVSRALFGIPVISFTFTLSLIVCQSFPTALAGQQEDTANRPLVKFFYYDQANLDWVVSSEPERLNEHLANHADSQKLLASLDQVVQSEEPLETTRLRMLRWIQKEREQFDQRPGNGQRFRRAEGIIAYLRSHDFSIRSLVEELKKRSAARDIELIAVHLVGSNANDEYRIKVRLIDALPSVNDHGYQVDLRSPEINHVGAVYALGVALYEVHESINSEVPAEEDRNAAENGPGTIPENTRRPDTEANTNEPSRESPVQPPAKEAEEPTPMNSEIDNVRSILNRPAEAGNNL